MRQILINDFTKSFAEGFSCGLIASGTTTIAKSITGLDDNSEYIMGFAFQGVTLSCIFPNVRHLSNENETYSKFFCRCAYACAGSVSALITTELACAYINNQIEG